MDRNLELDQFTVLKMDEIRIFTTYLVSTSTIETRSVLDETRIFYPSTATDNADFLIH